MAVNRLLYSTQTCLITVGGYLKDNSGTFEYAENDSAAVKSAKNNNNKGPWCPNGFNGGLAAFLLPVQTASTDVTIPMEDVLVMGQLGSVKRLQKEVATSKCSVKAYLADMMEWYDGSTLRDAGVDSWTLGGTSGTQQTAPVTRESKDAAGGGADSVDSTATDPVPATLQLRSAAGAEQGPWPGITQKGSLAGENWVQNGDMDIPAGVAKQGLLEQLIFEAIGGFESRVECFNPDSASDKDGFSFFGILSSISIDASKGAYPMLDLNWEGVGEVEYLSMGAKTAAGADTTDTILGGGQNAGTYYINKCHPHTSDDVLIWGRERTFDTSPNAGAIYAQANAAGLKSEDKLILIASNTNSYYQDGGIATASAHADNDLYGDNPANIDAALASAANQLGGIGTQGQTDTINSAKMSMDLPTETLTALGQVIEGNTTAVRSGNARFSKPPFKASIALDGNGLIMAAHEGYDDTGEVQEQVVPNEVQIGSLHCVVDAVSAATTARSFSQSVGDVGASYNISVEGTNASFYSTYQVQGGNSVPGSFDWNANRDVATANPE